MQQTPGSISRPEFRPWSGMYKAPNLKMVTTNGFAVVASAATPTPRVGLVKDVEEEEDSEEEEEGEEED